MTTIRIAQQGAVRVYESDDGLHAIIEHESASVVCVCVVLNTDQAEVAATIDAPIDAPDGRPAVALRGPRHPEVPPHIHNPGMLPHVLTVVEFVEFVGWRIYAADTANCGSLHVVLVREPSPRRGE